MTASTPEDGRQESNNQDGSDALAIGAPGAEKLRSGDSCEYGEDGFESDGRSASPGAYGHTILHGGNDGGRLGRVDGVDSTDDDFLAMTAPPRDDFQDGKEEFEDLEEAEFASDKEGYYHSGESGKRISVSDKSNAQKSTANAIKDTDGLDASLESHPDDRYTGLESEQPRHQERPPPQNESNVDRNDTDDLEVRAPQSIYCENGDEHEQSQSSQRRAADHDFPQPSSVEYSQPYTPEGFGVGTSDGDDQVGLQLRFPQGDRCATRGAARGEAAKVWGARRGSRGGSQASDDRRRLKARSMNVGPASRMGRERQERMIEQLSYDNGMLKRKVAGFQLALQLSADEDDFLATPSFSAAFSASPPAFPREGGPPPPSPRVTRGWSHQNRPVRRCPSIERDLPYTAVVRQLDTSSRRAQTLRRANEALGARVNDLESGAVLRATKARLSERDEEIVALRDELAVVNRLARAQDRKFDGSEGYAMARRLWVAEEEQRTARSAVTSLTAEVTRLQRQWMSRRQLPRRVRGEQTRIADNPAAGWQKDARRPESRKVLSPAEESAPHLREGLVGDAGVSGGLAGRGPCRPSGGSRRRIVTKQHVEAGGGGAVRGKDAAAEEENKARKDTWEMKAGQLQRALANMRSKAKGELRAAQTEIIALKEDKDALGRSLQAKAKEVRTQVLQVGRLKGELRNLSEGAAKLEEANLVLAQSPRMATTLRSRRVASAATGSYLGRTSGSDAAKGGRRTRSAAATGTAAQVGVTDWTTSGPLASVDGNDPGLGHWRSSAKASTSMRYSPEGWRRGSQVSAVVVLSPGKNKDTLEPTALSTQGARAGLVPRKPTDSGAAVGQRAVSAPAAASPGRGEQNTAGPGIEKMPAVSTSGAEAVGAMASHEVAAAATTTIAASAAAAAAAAADMGGPIYPPLVRGDRIPCPLSGILDMSEPPLRQYRRSFYSDDGNVYTSNPTPDGRILSEPHKEEHVSTCVVDSDGLVKHARPCVLSDMPYGMATTLGRVKVKGTARSFATDSRHLRASTIGIPIRTWSGGNDSTGAERLLLGSSSGSPRNSCVTEDGKIQPTINILRRPTHVALEAAPETVAST